MKTMIENMSISKKLPIMMVALAILNIAAVMFISGKLTIANSVKEAEEKLLTTADIKEDALKAYLASIEQDLIVTAQNGFTKEALKDFSVSWEMIDGNPTEYLQNAYLPDDLDAAKRIDVMKAKDGSIYSEYHSQYHPFFKEMLEKRGYYDIFLFDTKGNLVYTVFKELDYATNMYSGQWKDTDLANAYKAALNGKERSASFFDFKPYEPSYGAPASFISTPIFDNGRKIGALVFQMPIDGINDIMKKVDTLGETAVNVIVGRDGLFRNNPYAGKRENGDVILKDIFDKDLLERAFAAGEESYGENDKYTYGSDPMEFYGVEYMIITKLEKQEIMAPIIRNQLKIIMVALVILAVIALISLLVARTISKPLTRQVDVMGPLSKGDFSVDVPDQGRGDEIGMIAKAVQAFKENGLRVKQLEAQQAAQKVQAEQDKKAAQMKLADDFDGRVGGVISELADSAVNMTSTAQQMQASSQQTAEISTTVASAATEADSNVQTVAAAAEELSASSSEIARQIDAVAKKSSAASQDAQETSKSVNELNVLADSIGEVIGTIKDIAEQTNLLALNATIEAARAGEAGKGFAVVADEVKKLANETATKTEEIDERVNRIQEAIRNSVTAMDKIISNVSEIDQATTTVASAVEEQNAATAEIGRNVTEASTGTQQVSSSIIQVQQNASESGEASNDVLNAASQLKSQADVLRQQVEGFLNEIRGDANQAVASENTDDVEEETEAA